MNIVLLQHFFTCVQQLNKKGLQSWRTLNTSLTGLTQIWANNSDLPFSSELELLKYFASAPEGVAAAVSLSVSSTNYSQIVRRPCCLTLTPKCWIALPLLHLGAVLYLHLDPSSLSWIAMWKCPHLPWCTDLLTPQNRRWSTVQCGQLSKHFCNPIKTLSIATSNLFGEMKKSTHQWFGLQCPTAELRIVTTVATGVYVKGARTFHSAGQSKEG